jgi:hypothetical protein
MIKLPSYITFITFLLLSAQLYSKAIIETKIPPNSSAPFVAQQYNSWGPIHAPITIIQGGIITDLEKILNRASISKTLKSHWIKICIGTAVASYVWILYQIRFTCLLIKQHNSWCNWKSVIPINHLRLTNPADLLGQLKFDIGKKYAQEHIHHARCDVATIFIQDIHAELANLNTYLKLYETIQQAHCTRFFNFPFDVASIEEKKTRLYLILDLFMTSQTEKI